MTTSMPQLSCILLLQYPAYQTIPYNFFCNEHPDAIMPSATQLQLLYFLSVYAASFCAVALLLVHPFLIVPCYLLIIFLFLHKPMTFLIEQPYLFSPYPANVAHTHSADLQRSRPPDIQHPVNFKNTSVLPSDGPGPDISVQVKVRVYFQIYLQSYHPIFVCKHLFVFYCNTGYIK